MLANWQQILSKEGHFTPHSYAGFKPFACDLTGFRRPQLQGNPAKHYVAEAGKALPAIVVGMGAAVGSIADTHRQGSNTRFALPRLLVRWEPQDTREADVQTRLVEQAGKALTPEEVAVFDAGFSLKEVCRLTPRFVVRLAKNATMRRNFLPEYKGHGRHPQYGERLRPLARTRGDKQLEASPADETFLWHDGTICLQAHVWKGVVLPEEKPGAVCVNVVAVYDPRYSEPWLLATNLEVSAEVVWRLYRDRWAVEHLPLVAKPMLGCGAAFVFGQESRLRLPELALLCGNLLSYVAATCTAVATGFWDRACRATCGRLRRVLNRLHFSELPVLGEQLRKKASVTSHLVTGVEGHRRQKACQ
ncbi:transposase, partial [Armatimonas sp.]|uniref:transposase n=1 Tax=Armatimonas sp. TaxID=1872638 RepID=UPI00286CB6DC